MGLRLELSRYNWFKYHREAITKYVKETYGVDLEIDTYRKFKEGHVFSDGKERTLKKTSIFTNTSNGKVFLFDPFDRSGYVEEMVDILDKCPEVVHVVKSQFNPMIIPPRDNLTMGMYYPRKINDYKELTNGREIIPIVERTHDHLCFVGKVWRIRRKVLRHLSEECVIPEKMPLGEFIDYQRNLKMTLSLPGNGNICHREIECFGVGTPVICPTLENQLYDPLIPNEHYVEVDVSIKESPDVIAREILKRYNEVKNDEKLLQNISNNCFEWYNRNIIETPYASLDVGFKKILK